MSSAWTVLGSLVAAGALVACGSPASSGSPASGGPQASETPPLPGGQSGTDSMDDPPTLEGIVCQARSVEDVAFDGELAQLGASPEQVYAAVEGQQTLVPIDCSGTPSLALEVTRRPLAFVVEGVTEDAAPCVELVLGVGVHVSASDRSVEEFGSLLSLGPSGAILIPLGIEKRAQLSLQVDQPEQLELQTWSAGRFLPSYVLSTSDRCGRPVE